MNSCLSCPIYGALYGSPRKQKPWEGHPNISTARPPLKERGFYRARPHGGGPMASPWNPTQPNIFQTHSHALLFLSTKQDIHSRLELADATWAVLQGTNHQTACCPIIHVTLLGSCFLIFKIRGMR